MRRVIKVFLCTFSLVLAIPSGHASSVIDDIYQAQTITTGVMEETATDGSARRGRNAFMLLF